MTPTKKILSKTKDALIGESTKAYSLRKKSEAAKKKITSPSGSKAAVNKKPSKSPGKDNKKIKVSKSLIQPVVPMKEDKSQSPKDLVNRKPKNSPGKDKIIKVSKSLIQSSPPMREDKSKDDTSVSGSPRRSVRINKLKISKTPSPKGDKLNRFICSAGDGTEKNKIDSKQNTFKKEKTVENKLKKPKKRTGTSKVKSGSPTKQSTLNNFVVKKVDREVFNNDLIASFQKLGSAPPSGLINLMTGRGKKSPDTGNKKIKISKTSPISPLTNGFQMKSKSTSTKDKMKAFKSSPPSSTIKNKFIEGKQSVLKKGNTKENKPSNIKTATGGSQKNRRANTSKSRCSLEQPTLSSFITKKVNKTTLTRNDSYDSIDLPVFSKTKRVTKATKLKEQKSLFEKYGVVVPTVDEILSDKKDLEISKSKLRDFNPISEDSLQVPILEELRQSPTNERNLDCKHLTNQELEVYFNNNVAFLSDILSGKIKNSRHDRYFDQNNKVLTFSVNDLTYNTSTVVFSYEQLRFLVKLLSKHFDPEDTKAQYFFQVLLPELCLKIFTETHKMDEQEAVLYLDEKPIED